MGIIEIIIIVSIVVQLGAVGCALSLARTPCSRWTWCVLLVPLVLMLLRRVFVLFWLGQTFWPFYNELLALSISICFLWAMVAVRNVVNRAVASEKDYHDLTETLESRVEERTLQLEEVFKKMQKAKKQWERTFDAVPDNIMILDSDYNIVRINKAAAEALGEDPIKLIGRKCYHLVHSTNGPPKFCPHSLLLQDNLSHTAHAHINNLKGDFLISVHPLVTKDGRTVGAVHISRDVSELTRIQEQLREKKDRVMQLENAKTHDLLEVARSLNAGIAHELRTPMQSIMNTIELIEEWLVHFTGKSEGEGWTETLELSDIFELLSDAEDRATYSISVLESLSTYTKAESRKEVHLINVVSEIRTVMKTLRITDKFKCLSEDDFVLNSEQDGECEVLINNSDFMQLLINLCTNALEAIEHSEPKITVAVFVVNGCIEVHVVDNGKGVSPDLGDRIFVPYVSTKGEENKLNHGLGLSIVKNLTTLYGGEITYKSVPGHTDFCITFPCAKKTVGKGGY
jgi:PAS domain S-box-containing protein